ncbi:hypothetical protein AAC387_Pa02g1508 [Persea americana]
MMVSGGSRREDGSLAINSTNVFAALESLRRKKKSEKEQKSSKGNVSNRSQEQQENSQVFWAPAPLTGKSWADVDDDDDDDYYATTAPPQKVWTAAEVEQDPVEQSESEDDLLDEGDDDIEDEYDHELNVPVSTEPVPKERPQPLVSKETERQLSKKELKKKELAELEAVLAELGIPKKETNGQDDSHATVEARKSEEPNGELGRKENAISSSESKSAKKKKAKKDKSFKEVKDIQDQPIGSDNKTTDEATEAEPAEDDTSAIDVKERLKKMASMKKKKSSKEMDAAAKAAAIEAAARTAKVLAAKKKEKNHYNQQPVR